MTLVELVYLYKHFEIGNTEETKRTYKETHRNYAWP